MAKATRAQKQRHRTDGEPLDLDGQTQAAAGTSEGCQAPSWREMRQLAARDTRAHGAHVLTGDRTIGR
jgi:hypothetical protein